MTAPSASKSTSPAEVVTGLLVWAVIGLGIWAYFFSGPDTSASKVSAAVAAGDPIAFVQATIRDERRKPSAELVHGTELLIRISLDPIYTNASAKSGYLRDLKEVVPAVFEAFPAITRIDMRATATFVSVKGHESVQEAAAIEFARATAADINWVNVLPENIPKLADRMWFHPGFRDKE